MNINKQNAKLFLSLRESGLSYKLLFREVFGMTEAEAEEAFVDFNRERIEASHQVMAVRTQKRRNEVRRIVGFREKNDDVEPMPTSGLAHLMGFGPAASSEPEQEEEEL